ncbi:putative bifunctional diguanylate cyclase/phosphodiesterase [Oscillatoria acuminata]|uniref:Diguanylate cyclase (GGDEF) domain-containing protein n=1 Tax=Oscillatoria acuminata PCC 6304 TaxID=56110 RepID=K9TI81_9CYAN|nr:EAL domain-containing protein [Oscillatoria acuminata]AFY81841.1 diguanylate cyclase (GGDEF) domain-containing protein [Oscillatoria acuminata PCC 6304]
MFVQLTRFTQFPQSPPFSQFSQPEQLRPDRLPRFTPRVFESILVLLLVGWLLRWTPVWPVALTLLMVGIFRPVLIVPVSIMGITLLSLLDLQPVEGIFAYRDGVALAGVAFLGVGLGKFLRQVEWQFALQSMQLQLADDQAAGTPETVLNHTLSLLMSLVDADAAIALRQVDKVTAEAVVCLPQTVLADKFTSPQLFAEAVALNRCLYYQDYPHHPGAIRSLIAAGTKSLAILPLQPREGTEGLCGGILIIWSRNVTLTANLKRCLESLRGELRMLLQFQDTTWRLEQTTIRLGAILETIPQGVIFVDDQGEQSWLNPSAAQHLDLQHGEVKPLEIALAMAKLRANAENQEALCAQAAKLFQDPAMEIRNWQWVFTKPERKVLSISITATRIRNVPGRLWVIDDITDRYWLQQALLDRSQELSLANEGLHEAAIQQSLLYRQLRIANAELEKLATTDGLTQIPNRRIFDAVLAQEWKRLMRSQSPLSVILIDVDFFKRYNDTYGHQAGDECLKKIARAVASVVKRQGDLVARYGGEEFVVVLPATDGPGAVRVAEQIRVAVAEANLEHRTSTVREIVSLSQGIATLIPRLDTSPDELIAAADEALYYAKSRGRDRYVVFDRKMQDRSLAIMQVEKDLRLAIEREEFCLHYQPIVSLINGEIVGFEALVRWNHPQRGLVSPAEFIPIAEQTGLIISMSWWIFHAACCQLREWQLRFPDYRNLTMSINLSGKQLEQLGMVERLDRILRDVGVEASSIKLEIMETSLKESPALVTILNQLKVMGFQLAIDDFGTGYSSLSRLYQLPIDTLKIDRSFINQMSRNPKGLAIVEAIVILAQHTNITTISEGIETIAQLEQLQNLNCEFGQGYLFSKPLDSNAAYTLLAQNVTPRSLNCISVSSCQSPTGG